jgi:hypothetical protein
MTIFQPFPKLARLSRECVVTEKLDGTNAQIYITQRPQEYDESLQPPPSAIVGDLWLFAGSRTRAIFPGKTTDNFGFAGWVRDNAEELVQLGEGRHFGEWYGKGIQRGYGLDERRFALFHTHGIKHKPDIVGVVPTLYTGPFLTHIIDDVMMDLWLAGSKAVPGFMNPEGVVVFHTASSTLYKKTFDDRHKEAA